MIAEPKNELQKPLTRVEAVFIPGRLCDRREEMLRLQESGDTMLFTGGIQWSLSLTDYDKRLKGESESLDDAFGDMSRCLAFLASNHGEDTQVICAVKASPVKTGEKS